MPTIRDVARRAGVAPITVSRVINESGYVSDETRIKVETAIAELHYVPNTLARSLRSNRTKVLALIVTDITNPFWTSVARGVEDLANQHGFNVILCNTDESEAKQVDYVTVLLQKQVDGFLFVPARSTPESVRKIQSQNVPVVVLDRQVPGVGVDVVRGDSEKGAYDLSQLLIGLGHRRIAMLSGPRTISTSVQRVKGYQRALTEAGIPSRQELIYYSDYNQAGGYQMARQALATLPQPTALFAANNFIAMGALMALREAKVRVPRDVSVVCFDDIPPWLMIDPFLTVATQPEYAMGQRATQLLLDRLGGVLPPAPQEIVLPAKIIVRKSSGPPRDDAGS
jgi:LacI family transcriptional regulator